MASFDIHIHAGRDGHPRATVTLPSGRRAPNTVPLAGDPIEMAVDIALCAMGDCSEPLSREVEVADMPGGDADGREVA